MTRDGTRTSDARGLEEKLAFLRRPQSYADETTAVTVAETPAAWVFLTRRHAYKLKKPECHRALDLRDPATRYEHCEEEVRLNRRLAADIYLGTVPLTKEDDGCLAIGGRGVPVDWLIKMRRMPPERMLDRAIRAGTVKTRELRIVASLLAGFYRSAVPVALPPAEYRRRLADTLTQNRRTLADPEAQLSRRMVERVTASLRKFIMGQASLFDRRVRRGCIREGHGDLHTAHVFLGPKSAVTGCAAYDRDKRVQDFVDELSALAIDCEVLQAPGAGKLILETCSDRLGDAPRPELIAFYKARRAMMFASSAVKRNAKGWPDTSCSWHGPAEAYLALASRYVGQIG
ncbi:MAG: hypothetical protein JSU82_06865 [Rhodospirillales bacterium]|nr:MAG: hypothetical protein JSU82_06865 [Rhodospirillales bacterium]